MIPVSSQRKLSFVLKGCVMLLLVASQSSAALLISLLHPVLAVFVLSPAASVPFGSLALLSFRSVLHSEVWITTVSPVTTTISMLCNFGELEKLKSLVLSQKPSMPRLWPSIFVSKRADAWLVNNKILSGACTPPVLLECEAAAAVAAALV